MLLDDIIALAVDNKQPITTLLRKCIILAHQIKNERLGKWANEELDGYGEKDDLPGYRILGATATGVFVHGWTRFQQGIPSVRLEKDHRKFGETVYVSQPIGTLEEMVNSRPYAELTVPWSPNLVAITEIKYRGDGNCFLRSRTFQRAPSLES